MNAPSAMIRSIRTYFVVFVFLTVLVLSFINLELYGEGQKIREAVAQKTYEEAEKELRKAVQKSITELTDKVEATAEWDEVHQQLHDPSYYFFWHDERLKESSLFHSSFDSLELYNADKKLLMPVSPSNRAHFLLPEVVENTDKVFIFKPFTETYLNLFTPIYQRGSREVIGYVGVSVDFLDYLLKENTFFHVAKSSISLEGNGKVSADDIFDHIHFRPLTNPVSESLWQLIKSFIAELIVLLAIISVLISVAFNLTIYSPIKILSDYLKKLKTHSGIVAMPKKQFFFKEFEDLKQSIHDYHRDLQNTQAALDKQNQLVWEQARRDVLTNIYNRRAFDEAWNDVLFQYAREPIFTAFMLFDCDFFKALNDTYGHEIGDEVIRLTAKTIQDSLPLESPAYRIGGDEFAVIIQNRSPEDIMLIAKNCLHALSEANFKQIGIKEKISFSVGVSSTGPDHNNDIASLPRQADIAMYKAKQSLQSKIQCYHQALDQEGNSLVSNQVVNRVMHAVQTGEGIEMHYQPIYDVVNATTYYESLVRIRDEQDELIFPNDIFNVIQRRRIEVEFDGQIIKKVIIDLREGVIPKHSGVAVNISAKTLLQPFFVSLFDEMQVFLQDYKIVIEVTENALIDHMDYAKEVLNELRDIGFKIALDDFGSGYSSIRYLAHMPVDIIKFDRSLVLALCDDELSTQKIVESTALMILQANYDLVMEGVENEVMLNRALHSGATHIQGYLLGRPAVKPEAVSFKPKPIKRKSHLKVVSPR